MLVQEALKAKPPTVVMVAPTQTIHDAAGLLADRRPGILVVSDDSQRVIGVISEWDLLRGIAAADLAHRVPVVADVMVRDVPICRPTDQLADVRKLMDQQRRRHLPVVDGGKLKAIISIGDVLFHLFEEAQLGENALREYFLGLGYH